MLNKESLIELARATAKASVNPSVSFSYGDKTLSGQALNETFAQELKELGGTAQLFRENDKLIFTLMEVALTEVLPVKVMEHYGMFADIKTYPNNTKPVFKVRISEASKKRAKSFVSKVGLAGRYETFKLDGYTLEISTSAIGGAARVEWEELLSGNITLNDYYDLVLEGMDEAIYKEIAKSLKSAVNNIKTTNKSTQNAFDENEMDRLIQIADSYGRASIYCTFKFAATMIPQDKWVSDKMRDMRWENGYFTTYKGHNVIILPQSYEDETNTKTVVDDSVAYIIPTGAEKPVKVAFEGEAQVKQFENRDWSSEIHTYHKVGVATYLINPGTCVYINESLAAE